MNWDDLRFLLALGREGSLAAAARALGVDQTTVARRLRALEQALGGALFTRAGAAGWSPTAMGERVLARCTRIEADVAGLVHLAASERQAVQGRVRITTVDLLASAFLLPRLPALRRRHPALEIELVTANENRGVGRSETDIALRLARPGGGDLRIRRLVELGFACYRAAGTDAPDAWVAYDAGLSHTPEMRWLARQPGEAPRIVMRSNNAAVLAGAAAQGMGRALLPCCVGDAWPGLARDSGPQPVLVREVWMLLHRDARAHPRIAAAADWLAERFAEGAALLRNGTGAEALGYASLAGHGRASADGNP
ncbi:LysR family transcriptional regulator [Xylophilus sp.]|uniref:LysR family transcriptional regulator n=1 Tax=Xylophilus sp. TaxID=2653893 RepID=UPI0013BB87B9|nr:LysR family transcriptional regulator [Xylophilus sp.]KAF1047969.1 MAG: HTH-type transcriptional regulator YofA [Xylophilus sp.]